MAIKKFSFIAITLFSFCVSCASGTHQFKRNEEIVLHHWKKIAILPFSGAPHLRMPSSEWFSFRMLNQQRFQIISPCLAAIELKRQGVIWPRDQISTQAAQDAANMLGAQGVIVGSATINRFVPVVPALVEVKLIDATTGEIVCATVHSNPGMATFSDMNRIAAAVDSAAKDVLAVLNDLARKSVAVP
jgi:hypothetical protein